MRYLFSPKGVYLMAFALLIATNIFVLTGVFANRSGEPESQVLLTERELSLPYRTNKENSGLSLNLNWRALPKNKDKAYSNSGQPVWLNEAKLVELGFDVSNYKNKSKSYKRPLPIEVFVVLEQDGQTYQESLARAEAAYKEASKEFSLNDRDNKKIKDKLDRVEKQLTQEKQVNSRLFAIDAGSNPQKLRQKYSNKNHYIIAQGTVRLGYRYKDNNKVTGYIAGLSIKNIHVPLSQRKALTGFLAEQRDRYNTINPPRFSVNVAYGHRYEPWIEAVKPL